MSILVYSSSSFVLERDMSVVISDQHSRTAFIYWHERHIFGSLLSFALELIMGSILDVAVEL